MIASVLETIGVSAMGRTYLAENLEWEEGSGGGRFVSLKVCVAYALHSQWSHTC